jgi:hypothetical protein
LKTHKTTKTEFRIFEEEFLIWQDFFGLYEYCILFEHQLLSDAYAQISVDEMGKLVVVSLNIEITSTNMVGFDPRAIGKHEFMHLLTHRIFWLGKARFIAEDELEEEWERLTRLLEKI